MANPLTRFLNLFRTAPAVRMKVDPDAPFALYFEPSGTVRPLTMKSLAGMTDGDYNALNRSMNRSGNATASEIGYAYLSEINVWIRRCIEIRASNLKRLEWYVERDGKRIDNHPLTVAMYRSRHFFQRVERSLLTWGEVYVKPLKNEYGYYSDVWWLNNLSVSLTIVNGYITQFYYVPLHGGKPYIWAADEMCYLYTENAFDDLRGSSRILAVLAEANVHEEIARAAQAHFANDARPGIMFIPERDLGVDRAQEFMDYWKANFQGTWNTNKPVVMPQVIKTVQTIERAKLEDDVSMRGSIRREICAGFGVPLSVAGAWDDANYQSAPEQRISLYEETIIPEAEQIAEDLTRDLLPFFDDQPGTRVWFDGKNLLALAEDKQAKAQALNAQLISGGITLNQYRQELDYEALPEGNVFYIPAGVTVTPVEKLGSMPAPQLPGGGSPFGLSAPVQPAQADAPALPDATQKDAPSLAIMVSLANQVDLVAIQQRLKELFNGQGITWASPADLHMTMVYAPVADDAAVDALVSAMPDYLPGELPLKIGSIGTFDKAGQHALYVQVSRTTDLMNCQRDLLDLVVSCGMQVSTHSTDWKPHVTMGYSQQPIRRITFNSGVTVRSGDIVVSLKQDGQKRTVYQGGGQVIEGSAQPAPVKADASEHPFMEELSAYGRFVVNRWGQPARTFEFNVLPVELQQELAQQIAQCPDKTAVRKLFDGLKEALKKSDEDVVTPEQAQEWWGEYDKLMRTLGNDWLRDYMREVWRKLEPRLNREIEAGDVAALLTDFHPDLITKWTGTAEEPGVIAKLFMAGMGAGQQALVRKRTNMNPLKASDLVIDWELVPSDAIAAVEKYVGKLIRGIDSTTLEDVQRIIEQWLESGLPVSELSKQLQPIFNDTARADVIARTESSNAYTSGAINRWEEVGVEKVKWQTVRDSRICDICEPLHNKVSTIEQGFGTRGLLPAAHPNCRCYLKPVL